MSGISGPALRVVTSWGLRMKKPMGRMLVDLRSARFGPSKWSDISTPESGESRWLEVASSIRVSVSRGWCHFLGIVILTCCRSRSVFLVWAAMADDMEQAVLSHTAQSWDFQKQQLSLTSGLIASQHAWLVLVYAPNCFLVSQKCHRLISYH